MPDNSQRPFLGQVSDDVKVKTVSSVLTNLLGKLLLLVVGYGVKATTDSNTAPTIVPAHPPRVERVIDALMEALTDGLNPDQILARLQRENEGVGFPFRDKTLVALSTARLSHDGPNATLQNRLLVHLIAINEELGLPLRNDDLLRFATEFEKRL